MGKFSFVTLKVVVLIVLAKRRIASKLNLKFKSSIDPYLKYSVVSSSFFTHSASIMSRGN